MDQATNQDNHKRIPRPTSSPETGLTTEEGNATINLISQEELRKLRSEIRQTAERIFDNWRNLESIVQRHEATIQKRWTHKSKTKRKELLLTTWPNMSRDHRPDLVLENKFYSATEMKKDWEQMMQGKPRQIKMYEGSQREALLMPYINLHDLTKTEPLLLMINARARRHPHEFSSRDLQLSTRCIDLTRWRGLKGYIMDFGGQESGPAAYGELRKDEWRAIVIVKGADTRLANGKINPGYGLWILEIQDRIYKFLLDIAIRILHDIPASDLTGPKFDVKPEPPLPSANSRDDGVVSLASTNLEAIYSSPGQMDLHRLQLLVSAKASEEEDKLWALREDPGRFSEGLESFTAHDPEYVSNLLGTKHPQTTINASQTRLGSSTKSDPRLTGSLLVSTFICVEFWSDLLRDITDLVKLKKQHFDSKNVEPSNPLPRPFAIALHKLQFSLCRCVEQQVSVLRMTTFSSPPLRPYTQQALRGTYDDFVSKSDKWPPQHIFDFMTILHRLFYDDVYKTGHIAGVQSLMEQYDMFINTVPNAHQAVSPYVAQEISTLALLSECLRQIHLFQPWLVTCHEEIGTPHVQAVLMAHLDKERREIRPLANFKSSLQVREMAAAASKSPYPVHKRRTVANVAAMQNAETLLDRMWEVMLAEMEQQDALPKHSKNVLFSQGRQVQRTPDWVEPVKHTKKTAPQVAPEALVQPFGRLSLDDTRKEQNSPREKTKIKTRGTAAPQPSASTQGQTTEPEDKSSALTIQVDRRALKFFSTLFHKPSSTSLPGDVLWTEFLHAMHSAGFGIEKLQGSAWQFTPDDRKDSCMGAGMRSILFHEPHPHSRIPFWDARRHGRRLARAYGWSGETFVMK